MPIDVRGPDGTIYRVNTDDEQVARRTVRNQLARSRQETEARQRSGDPRVPGSVLGNAAGAAATQPPADPYLRARQRRAAERAPISAEEMRTGRLRNGGRDIPVPEWLIGPAQALQNFNRTNMAWQGQMPRNMGIADEMAAGSTYLGQGTENLIRRARGQDIEIPASTAARAAADYENTEGARIRRQMPNQDAIANAANIIAFAGRPSPAQVSILEAGAGAAGVNAPFALARQEGDLVDRLPGAAQETAIAGGLGAGLQGLGNMLTRQVPNSGRLVQNADRLGVPPNLAMTGGPMERIGTRMVSENLFAGGRTRQALTDSMTGTRNAAQRTAASYGRVQQPEAAGATVQRGLRRYATDESIPNPQPTRAPLSVPTREWSRASKARAVFDEALRPIEGNAARFGQTRIIMRDVLNQADSASVRAFQKDPVIEELVTTLNNTPNPTLRDLRELRRKIRMAQDTPSLGGQTRDNANLQRIEGALTEDIYAAAGPNAANLRRADAWYRRSKQRMDGLLETLGGENATPQQAYNTLTRWANQRTANSRGLASVRAALRDDEWRSFVASYVNHMGQPSPGASGMVTDIGFSVHNFARAYREMTPQARRIFFGGPSGSAQNQLMRDLDDLAEIALSQKAIENMGTPSGRDMQNFATGAAALANLPMTVLGLIGMAGAGELMTSPAFVRWLTSASRSGAGAGGMRRQLTQLSQIAARDPAVVPYYEAYLSQIGETESPAPVAQPAGQE